MVEESLAARRHRIAREIRNASSVDAAASVLAAFERDMLQEGADIAGAMVARAEEDRTHPIGVDALEEVDVPWELCELESLPDWSYVTLLAYAVQRRDAPTYNAATMRAEDLLECRRFELIGVLALACEQAFELGDAKTCHAMARLCQSAVVQVIGAATLRVAFGAGDDKAGEG